MQYINKTQMLRRFVTQNYIKLSVADEWDLRRLIKTNNNAEDAQKLLRSCLPFIFKKAVVFSHIPNTDIEDLFSCGIMGVIEAIPKDKLRGKHRFISFAWYYMRMAMHKYLNKDGRLIQIPWGMIYKTNNADNNYTAFPVSLEMPVRSDDSGSVCLKDTVEVDVNISGSLEHDESIRTLKAELEKLDTNEYKVICSYYGLNAYDSMTFTNISKTFGIPRREVSKFYNNAMSKLRESQVLKESFIG